MSCQSGILHHHYINNNTVMLDYTNTTFPQTQDRFLNLFLPDSLNVDCQLANQLSFLPVLCGTTVMNDGSSMKGVVQCKTELNSSSRTADSIDCLQAFLLLLQIFDSFIFPLQSNETSTHVIMVYTEETIIFWFQLGTSFSHSEPIYFRM